MYKDDAISREYCLDTIAKLPLNWEYGLGVEDCYKIVENAPSIDGQVCKWIRVEEALPASVIAPCLVYADGQIEIADWSHDKYGNDQWFYVDGEYEIGVTHWMPLPEPLKEDEPS